MEVVIAEFAGHHDVTIHCHVVQVVWWEAFQDADGFSIDFQAIADASNNIGTISLSE